MPQLDDFIRGPRGASRREARAQGLDQIGAQLPVCSNDNCSAHDRNGLLLLDGSLGCSNGARAHRRDRFLAGEFREGLGFLLLHPADGVVARMVEVGISILANPLNQLHDACLDGAFPPGSRGDPLERFRGHAVAASQ